MIAFPLIFYRPRSDYATLGKMTFINSLWKFIYTLLLLVFLFICSWHNYVGVISEDECVFLTWMSDVPVPDMYTFLIS